MCQDVALVRNVISTNPIVWVVRGMVVVVMVTMGLNICVFFPAMRTSQQRKATRRRFITQPVLGNSNLVHNPHKDPLQNQTHSQDRFSRGKHQKPLIEMLQEAGVRHISSELLDQIPTWQQVIDLYGEQPVIGGLQRCQQFQEAVPEERRMLGSAGMFSTGTNLVTVLLKGNCQIPARVIKYGVNASKEAHGMRWQVPYGKHTPEHYRYLHSTEKAKEINKDDLLPVVTIRNPWTWMKSMCHNPYSARWPHFRKCPNLRDPDGQWNQVTVKYGAGSDNYTSLAHLYNDWYAGYDQHAQYPYVMIRIEDLVFHTKKTITQVCECAGGKIRDDRPFQYVVDSAKKDSPGHDVTTGIVQALIKYGKPVGPRGGMALDDYNAAKEALNGDIMRRFGYNHPPES